MITVDELKSVMPVHIRKGISKEAVDNLNKTLRGDPDTLERFKEGLISYSTILKDGRYKLDQYFNAVKYVTYKTMELTNVESWSRTFPDRYNKLVAQGKNSKEISAHVAAYNSSQLVSKIYELTLTPTWILNAGLYQRVINSMAEIHFDPDINPRERVAAGNSLLQHIKAPENKKIELDIGITQNTVIEDYESAMSRMVAKQKELIEQGGDLKSIVNASIKKVEGEVIE